MGVLKRFILTLLCFSGMFHLTKLLYRNKLAILCYHGISTQDEHRWWPGVFMTEEKFHSRMKLIKRWGFNVIGLKEGVDKLQSKSLNHNSVVLTVDDGFYNTPGKLITHTKHHNFPLTVYVTTYYVENQVPIFNVAIQYAFWATKVTHFLPKSEPLNFLKEFNHSELDSKNKHTISMHCIEYGKQYLDEKGRQSLLKSICECLNISYEMLIDSKALSLMDKSQVEKIISDGIDVQLHTHRHRFPNDHDAMRQEIIDNSHVLTSSGGTNLEHFCFPSGIWEESQLPMLKSMGIKSATTCNIGFNQSDTNPLALKRFLDNQNIADIEFLAELCGVMDVLRKFRNTLKQLLGKP